MKKVILALGCMVWLGMGSQSYAALGDTGEDLIYTPVAPCRIIDTRPTSGGSGPIPGGTTKDFLVTGTTDFTSQGGNPAGCGITDSATSVMINLIAINPSTGGHLRAWPYGGTMPNASIVNFVPGFNIANGLIQPICDAGTTTCTYDLSIYAASTVNVVADVTAYVRRFRIEGSGSIPALEAKLDGLTRAGGDFIITNANLYIQSGSGETDGTVNGKGNLIIGYTGCPFEPIRTGSHNLIGGKCSSYGSYGGIVVGFGNSISTPYASVSGGYSRAAGGVDDWAAGSLWQNN